MSKGLNVLEKQLRKQGFMLIRNFDNSISPGTILNRKGANNLNNIGHLKDDKNITEAILGQIEGPKSCMIQDFSRTHEMTVNGGLDLLNAPASVRGKFKGSSSVDVRFEGPVTYARSLIKLEDAVEEASGFWDRNVGQRILAPKNFVVYA